MPDQPFSALYLRNFRLFWVAQLISLSGTWMHMTAQGWLVYRLTRSPLYLGIAGAALSLPMLLFTLLGGILADRYPKRDILIVTQSLGVIPPLLMGVLTQTGVVNVWHAIAVAFMMGTVNAFDIPARQSFLVEMVGRGRLLNAIALNSAAFNGARILGPMAAGLIISEVGLPACFFINALSFVPVVLVLKRMNIKGLSRTGAGGVFGELEEGLRFLLGHGEILSLMVMIAVISLFGIPFSQFLPVFAEDVLHIGARGLGYLMGFAGAGAFAAAMVIAFRGGIEKKGRYMSVAVLTFPAALITFTMSRYYPLSAVTLAVTGWAVVSFLATANSFIQLNVRDELRGRVMSVYSLLFLGMAPVGNSLIGFVADRIGTTRALAIAGGICLLTGALFSRAWMRKTARG